MWHARIPKMASAGAQSGGWRWDLPPERPRLSFSPIMRAWLQRALGVDHWASGGRLSRVLDGAIISFACQRNANSKQGTQTGMREPLVQSPERRTWTTEGTIAWSVNTFRCRQCRDTATHANVSTAKFVTFISICFSRNKLLVWNFPMLESIYLLIYPSLLISWHVWKKTLNHVSKLNLFTALTISQTTPLSFKLTIKASKATMMFTCESIT